MKELKNLGKLIKKKRLALNMRMDDVARKADITRATLWSIEKGLGNCSINSLIKVLNVLGISFSFDSTQSDNTKRHRASRTNTLLDKKINRFIIMCVEQFASYSNRSSADVYKEMNDCGVINELRNDYEDLHGMSTTYINEYINAFLGGAA